MSYFDSLTKLFPNIEFQEQISLAPFTTVKIGGPAEVFCKLTTTKDLIAVVQFAKQNSIPVTIIGWGANTLIADAGLPGLVIKNLANEIEVLETPPKNTGIQTPPRWQADNSQNNIKYQFSDLDYQERPDTPRVAVKMASGVSLAMAINTLLAKEITGLQWYSRIPASIGGAIYNNIHGGTHFLGEILSTVDVITAQGELKTLNVQELDLAYDYSVFHTTDDVIVSAEFALYKGDVEKAKKVALDWAVRKKVQPQNSLGCIFQNLTPTQQATLQLPTNSIGYLIDKELHLSGYQVGDAKISEKHSAFIENVGNATAADYLAVIKKIATAAQEKHAVRLLPEIFFLGFTEQELAGIVSSE